jgi:putative DNA primase/helicase
MSTITGSRRPQALGVEPDNIPAELRAVSQWVVWRYVEETDPDTGELEWDKPPVNARNGNLASSTNPRTWASYDEALAAYQRGGLDGIGFVLRRAKDAEDAGLVAIDLDKCRNPDTGVIEPWAQEIITEVNSYTELSPSARGIRIFLYGTLPATGRKKGKYENYCTGRYMTVTGQHISSTLRTIEHRQGELEAVHQRIFGAAEADGTHRSTSPREPIDLADAEIVEKASRAKNGVGAKFKRLWSGDRSGFNSASEADLALCSYLAFWCGPDQQRIADLFAQSGLFRPKWNREDYRARTIGKALAGRTEFYQPRKRQTTNGRHKENGGGNVPQSDGQEDFHLTDRGNAQRVVAQHGKDLRFCHPWKRWLVFDGRRWAQDATAEAAWRVKRTQDDLYRSTIGRLNELTSIGDAEERKQQMARLTRLLRHCLDWEDARSISRCLQVATSEPDIPIVPEQLDVDPFLLNCLNGTLELRTGTLRDHRRADNLTKLCPVEYRADAACPLWEKFLSRVLDGNADLIEYLQRVIGHCLTADASEQALWFLYGTGANGKSTFLGTILAMLGDYGMQAVSDLLLVKRNESHPTERADLFGKRFVATIEVDEGKRMAEALMKQLTGGDRVRARKMRQDFFEFGQTWKIMMAVNHKPTISGTDKANWRRIKLVPFTVTIPDEEKDKKLLDKLKTELPGILAWAVRGFLAWQKHGLGEPEEVTKATDAYRVEQDTLAEFLATCCVIHPEIKVRTSALLDAYVEWSGDHEMTAKAFTAKMAEKKYASGRGTGGLHFYHGVGLPTGSSDR